MRAVRVSTPGGPEVLQVADVDGPPPAPDPGQLLVRVAAAGVNFIDVYQRSGLYAVPTPFTLGLEGAGTVVAGTGPDGIGPGARVAWAWAQGSYAELVLVPAAAAVPVPDGVDDQAAAAVMLQGMTAQYLCTSTYPVQPGDWVVVHAAAGGTGLLLTQLVKRRGGLVLATTSSPEKAELARGAGADEVVGYDGFAEAARRVTGGRGVAAVYDGVGAATFDAGLDALRPRGVMALFGGSSGPVPALDPQVLNRKGSLYLTRPTLVHHTAERSELLGRAADVLGAVAAGELSVRIDRAAPLADAAAAHRDLEGRRTTGKLLLVP